MTIPSARISKLSKKLLPFRPLITGPSERQIARQRLVLASALLGLLVPIHLAPPLAAQGLGMPGPNGCLDDEFEPNSSQTPTLLSSSQRIEANICLSDDWYAIDLAPGQIAGFDFSFSHAAGDIDVTLYELTESGSLAQLQISESATDIESLHFVATEPTSLRLQVYGYGGATNTYAMVFQLDDYGAGCRDTTIAVTLNVGDVRNDRVCLGQSTEFLLEAVSDQPLEVMLQSEHRLGDLDVAVYDADGQLLGSSRSHSGREHVRLTVEEPGPVRVTVYGHENGFGRFTVSTRARDDGEPLVVRGRLTTTRRVPSPEGLKGVQTLYPEGILVELIGLDDGLSVARTTTDADGRYRFRLDRAQPSRLALEVRAQLETADYRMRVMPSVDATAHSLRSHALDTYAYSDGRLELDLTLGTEHPLTGALNICNTARIGLEIASSIVPMDDLDVPVVWNQGLGHSCGSCYSDGVLFLAGAPADTDEFDDIVILHELGHLLVDHLGWDDSPGGAHDGSRTNPLIAYGEGLASGFSLTTLGTPQYIDTARYGNRAYEDMEGLPFLAAYSTSDGTESGLVSEWTVAGLFWDLVDPASGSEPFDRIELRQLSLLRVLFGLIHETRRPDLGRRGMDLADLLNHVRCAFPHEASALIQLADQHQGFPMAYSRGEKCEWSSVQ